MRSCASDAAIGKRGRELRALVGYSCQGHSFCRAEDRNKRTITVKWPQDDDCKFMAVGGISDCSRLWSGRNTSRVPVGGTPKAHSQLGGGYFRP